MKVSDIDLNRPDTPPLVIDEVVELCQVLPATLPLIITEDMLIEVDLGNKIPVTHPLEMREHGLMLKGAADIGLRLDTINPITKVNVLYC